MNSETITPLIFGLTGDDLIFWGTVLILAYLVSWVAVVRKFPHNTPFSTHQIVRSSWSCLVHLVSMLLTVLIALALLQLKVINQNLLAAIVLGLAPVVVWRRSQSTLSEGEINAASLASTQILTTLQEACIDKVKTHLWQQRDELREKLEGLGESKLLEKLRTLCPDRMDSYKNMMAELKNNGEATGVLPMLATAVLKYQDERTLSQETKTHEYPSTPDGPSAAH